MSDQPPSVPWTQGSTPGPDPGPSYGSVGSAADHPPPRRRRSPIGLILLLLLLAAPIGLAALVLTSRSAPVVTRDTWLRVELGSPFPEERPEGRGWLGALQADVLSAQDLSAALWRARDDDRIAGVLLCPDGFAGGWSQAQEIVAALGELKTAGKQVWAYVESPGPIAYCLATACDRIAVPPEGGLFITGLEARMTHLKGTLDKLGLQADFVAIGEYKSAPEALTRETPSDPARQQVAEYLDDVYDEWIAQMAEGRGLDRDRMADLVDRGYFESAAALAEGLVDTVQGESELWHSLQPHRDHPRTIAPLEYLASSRSLTLDARHRLALIYATGEIHSGESGDGGLSGSIMGSSTVVERLQRAADDDRVRAVVLRVDSPGGSVTASDLIWREVDRVRDRKPVVVSMGDVAASGGYYISMSADRIVANPLTLTGSIGVFLGKIDIGGLYRKLGINVEVVQRGENAGVFSELQPFTPEQRTALRQNLEEFYGRFVERVARGRELSHEHVDEVAKGRVWSGQRALEAGLVDSLGTLHDALGIAKDLAGLDPEVKVPVDTYQEQPGVFDRMLADVLRDVSARAPATIASVPRVLLPAWDGLRAVVEAFDGSPQFRMPWTLRIE